MARERFDVEVPDGQHLGVSRDTDGAFRAHLFDDKTNGLVGHAELFAPGDDDMDWLNRPCTHSPGGGATGNRELTPEEAEAIEALVRLGIIVAALAVKAAAPHVARWWHSAIPAIKSAGSNALLSAKSVGNNTVLTMQSTWSRLTRASEVAGEPVSPKEVSAVETAGIGSSTELALAFQDCRARMSSEEARNRLVAALVARAFSEEQSRLLRDVQIEDDGARLSANASIWPLTPQQVGQSFSWMLENNPSLLEPASLTQLKTILGDDRGVGHLVRLKIEGAQGGKRLGSV